MSSRKARFMVSIFLLALVYAFYRDHFVDKAVEPAPIVPAQAKPVAVEEKKNLNQPKDDQFLDCRGMFEALTDPKLVGAAKLTELSDDEEVLGLSVDGVHRAYPTRFIAWHHIVNDVINGQPVAVSYCMICNTGIAFDASVKNERYLFNVFGLYRGVLAMYSRDKSGKDTVWTHMDGVAVSGPEKGKELKAIPVINTTWGEWKRLHPDTTTPSWDTGFDKRTYQERIDSGKQAIPGMFWQTMKGLKDDRLPLNTLVLALRVDDQQRAYPYAELKTAAGVVQEVVGKTAVTVFFVEKTSTPAAFDSNLDGKLLEFVRHPTDASLFVERASDSHFTVEGVCVEGKLKGRQLTRLNFLQSRWYGWSALFPQTTIFTVN